MNFVLVHHAHLESDWFCQHSGNIHGHELWEMLTRCSLLPLNVWCVRLGLTKSQEVLAFSLPSQYLGNPQVTLTYCLLLEVQGFQSNSYIVNS